MKSLFSLLLCCAPLPRLLSADLDTLAAAIESPISVLYEDTDLDCSHQFVSIGAALSAELERIASPIPAPSYEKGSFRFEGSYLCGESWAEEVYRK